MINQKKSDTGFISLELVLLVFIVLVIGSISWFVLHSKKTTDNLLNGAQSVSSSQPASTSKAQAQPQNAASSTSNPTTPSTTTSPKKTSDSLSPVAQTPITHPTADDIQNAAQQAFTIHALIESFWANTGYYPNNLDANALTNQQGVSGVSTSVFTAPQGTTFYYSCTKGGTDDYGNNQCGGFIFEARKSDGSVIKSYNW